MYLDEIQQAVTVTRDDTRLTASSSCCQVDSEILRIHAMKDRALLAALQVPWQSEVLIEEHCPLRLGDPKSVQNCACCILKCQCMSFYPHIPLLKLGRFMYCIQFAHLEIEVPAKPSVTNFQKPAFLTSWCSTKDLSSSHSSEEVRHFAAKTGCLGRN